MENISNIDLDKTINADDLKDVIFNQNAIKPSSDFNNIICSGESIKVSVKHVQKDQLQENES